MKQKGEFEDEFRWAIAHPDDPDTIALATVALLYAEGKEPPSKGLIDEAAYAIRKKMQSEEDED